MVSYRSKGDKIFDSINILFLSILMVVCIYPLLYVVFASFSDPTRLVQHRGILFKPLGFTLKGYELVLGNPDIGSGYLNTLIYVVVGTGINLFMTSISAYVLSRRGLLWGKLLMIMITIPMFFSGGLIPSYLLIKNLGLYNSRLAILLPTAIASWNLIIMRTSMMGIPASLEESARIDGAGDFKILVKIILPLSKATLAVMTLFYAVGHWNSWFSAMVYLRDRALYPLQLILREILIKNDVDTMTKMVENMQQVRVYENLVQYSTIVVATVPILFVYPFLQKYFAKGVMIGSLKG